MEYLEASAQAEQVKAIGARLLEERRKQGISLDEVAAKTYIPLRLLSAIEVGNMNSLPEPVFIQGFIRRYADVLGLDGTAISKEFPVNLSPVPVAMTSQLLTEATPSPSKATASPEPSRLQTAAIENTQPRRNREFKLPSLPWIPIAGAVGLGVLAIVAATAFKPGSEKAKTVAPVSSVAPAKPPAKANSARKDAVNVKMNVIDDSWVEVVVDGQSVYGGTLTKGTTRSWTGKKQVAVTAGNASGVSLSYNDGAMKTVGAPGEVKTITFPQSRN